MSFKSKIALSILVLPLLALSLSESAAYCFSMPFHHKKDESQKAMVFHTASKKNKVIQPEETGLNTHDWNPFSKRKMYIRHLAKVSQAGGYSNINVPFQNSLWSPMKKDNATGQASKPNPPHLLHPGGFRNTGFRPAKSVAARPHHRFLIF